MVKVFKTTVVDELSANKIVHDLLAIFPGYLINFDLDDCDRILRIEGDGIDDELVLQIMTTNELYAEQLF